MVGLSVTEFAPQPGASELQQQTTINFVERLIEELWREREDDTTFSRAATSRW